MFTKEKIEQVANYQVPIRLWSFLGAEAEISASPFLSFLTLAWGREVEIELLKYWSNLV